MMLSIMREELCPSATNALVSVIVPAYNSSAYIRETLDSVFGQTFTNFEVIVINGGSPDSEQLELALRRYRDSIVYIKQDNHGVAADRNAGIRAARGEYLAFLDGDDLWFPEYLATQMKWLQGAPSLDMVYCDQVYFGDESDNTGIYRGGARRAGTTCMQGTPSKGPVTFESLLMGRCSVVTSSTVVRRSVVIECGMFEEKMLRAEDFHMWLRVAHHGGRIGYHTTVLGRHRLHSGSLASDFLKSSEAIVVALQHLSKSISLSPTSHRLVQQRIERCQAFADLYQGKSYLAAGQIDKARYSLAMANGFFRSPKLRLVLMGLDFVPHLTHIVSRAYMKHLLK